jgi:hypothetical protein
MSCATCVCDTEVETKPTCPNCGSKKLEPMYNGDETLGRDTQSVSCDCCGVSGPWGKDAADAQVAWEEFWIYHFASDGVFTKWLRDNGLGEDEDVDGTDY